MASTGPSWSRPPTDGAAAASERIEHGGSRLGFPPGSFRGRWCGAAGGCLRRPAPGRVQIAAGAARVGSLRGLGGARPGTGGSAPDPTRSTSHREPPDAELMGAVEHGGAEEHGEAARRRTCLRDGSRHDPVLLTDRWTAPAQGATTARRLHHGRRSRPRSVRGGVGAEDRRRRQLVVDRAEHQRRERVEAERGERRVRGSGCPGRAGARA